MTLSKQEQWMIEVIRSLKPFERIEIVKDASGKPGRFIVRREEKVMLSEIKIEAIQ